MDPENDFIESERAGQSAHTTMSDPPYELLLIEDNPRDVELFREYLDGATAANQMEHYPSLADAKTVLNSDSFDLIILDLDLEDSRGLDTFAAIRKTAPETPIIILTGHKDHKLGKTAIEQGAQDYLFKQEINTHWLNKAINYAIERYDFIQELQSLKQTLEEENQELENASQRFEELSYNDELTGIPNRRQFEQTLETLWGFLKRYNMPISLIMIDIDYFKEYNDSYGHQTGDECLQNVARALGRCVNRKSDTMARYGGEEFAGILPNTTREGADQMAENMRESVQDLAIRHEDSKIEDVLTICLGVSTCEDLNQFEREELIERADDALYDAKENGRNHVAVYGE